MDISGLSNHIVSITQFNKGQASPLFLRASKGEPLLVVKNNTPLAVILSSEEYDLLRSISKACNKLCGDKRDTDISELQRLLEKLRVIDNEGGNNV